MGRHVRFTPHATKALMDSKNAQSTQEPESLLQQSVAGIKEALSHVYDSTIQKMERSAAAVDDSGPHAPDSAALLSVHIPHNNSLAPVGKPALQTHTVTLPHPNPVSEEPHRAHNHTLSPEKLGLAGYVKDVGGFVKDLAHDLRDKARNFQSLDSMEHPPIWLPADEEMGVFWEVDTILGGEQKKEGKAAESNQAPQGTTAESAIDQSTTTTPQDASQYPITSTDTHKKSFIVEAATKLFPHLQGVNPPVKPNDERERRSLHPEDHQGGNSGHIRESHSTGERRMLRG
ncbi:hypothetical protein BC937DRAFT_90435 [Endogone sp. FLAS-F59071]|nr:hypothetical protein BC937DRAFT_90435 [Endogone sp. FLAS-F59071]|eukprot:RUS17093.1 hypothetical protein BC937DRAFT_90435 [Endogone sp. FLAS-F59071]